jgi:hypothetical protein
MKKLSKFVLIRSFTILALIMLPILGTDCEDIINQINNNPCSGTNTIAGTWNLIYNAGTLNDICPGEQVIYPSSSGGTATLTCPNRTGISRLYSVSGSTLTYTETNAQYTVSFTENCELVLTGINNGRILYYSVQSSDKTRNIESKPNSINSNSSETSNVPTPNTSEIKK